MRWQAGRVAARAAVLLLPAATREVPTCSSPRSLLSIPQVCTFDQLCSSTIITSDSQAALIACPALHSELRLLLACCIASRMRLDRTLIRVRHWRPYASIQSAQLGKPTQNVRLCPRSAGRHRQPIKGRFSLGPPTDADQHPAHPARR
jgi:hypothetical protein